MQASRTWEPPGGTLGRILQDVRESLPSLGRTVQDGSPGDGGAQAPFAPALRRDHVAVIAELKRRSPSQGILNQSLDASQAVAFERGGAAAVSVLTEPRHFGGSIGDLVAVRQAIRLPLLRKDFHVAPVQLAQARNAGASAVLLIARALSPDQLPAMMATAKAYGLEPVVEVRSESELERAAEAGAAIIGVNSRDLETLEVDEGVPARLIPLVPPAIVAVWESGVATPADVRRAADAGADAVLVGSALSTSPDPAALIRELAAVPRKARD